MFQSCQESIHSFIYFLVHALSPQLGEKCLKTTWFCPIVQPSPTQRRSLHLSFSFSSSSFTLGSPLTAIVMDDDEMFFPFPSRPFIVQWIVSYHLESQPTVIRKLSKLILFSKARNKDHVMKAAHFVFQYCSSTSPSPCPII